MTLLLDADVLIDVALARVPFDFHAAALLDRLEARPGSAHMAWHTISNFFYLVSPVRGRLRTKEFLVDLARFVKVAPATTEALRYAASLPMADFEDAMQVAAAVACGADLIVTRNSRDFARSPIRAVSPEAALARW